MRTDIHALEPIYAAALENEPGAVDALLEKLHGWVVASIRKRTVFRDLDDIIQVAMIKIWRSLPRFLAQRPPIGKLLNWTAKIGYSQLIDEYRRANNSRTRTVDGCGPADDLLNFAAPQKDNSELHHDSEQLRWAMEQLPQRERQVLEWSFFQKTKAREIALHLGIKQNQVRLIRFRAIAKLREILADRIVYAA